MTPQLKNLLILLAGIVVLLIVIIFLFSGKSRFQRILSIFLEESDNGENSGSQCVNSGGANSRTEQRKTSEPIVEMATLIRKSDDRLRVIESTGQIEIKDAYYELVFVTRKGQKIAIQCSPEAYEKMPFNQQGSLTYKRNTLVKFKYYEDTVYN